jgi:hypothetical protein
MLNLKPPRHTPTLPAPAARRVRARFYPQLTPLHDKSLEQTDVKHNELLYWCRRLRDSPRPLPNILLHLVSLVEFAHVDPAADAI